MKKLIGMTFVVLFMMSMTTSNFIDITDPSFNYDHCFEVASEMEQVGIDEGFTDAEAYNFWNSFYEVCVQMEDEAARDYWLSN